VRLRIRLASGVKLIDVLGSRRHDEAGAQRVREAEQSIDRRIARNLGIEADRGEDEEGIQIVIPSFYADDAHVILLDVVAPRVGSIADVTVRYKDLVTLRNGVARANLSIGSDRRVAGPLELNVLKNLVARTVSGAIRQAGLALGQGQHTRAVALLAQVHGLLEGLANEVPGWADDSELKGDARMIAEFLEILGSGVANDGEGRRYLADSLQYAAFLKVVPPLSQ
jgi:hypothetical protein